MSWVILRSDTGEVVAETFDRKTAEKFGNSEIYEVVPVSQYLGELNKKIKDNTNV